MTAGFIVVMLFAAFCIFVGMAPGDLVKALLALAWVLMLLGGIGSFVWEVVRRL